MATAASTPGDGRPLRIARAEVGALLALGFLLASTAAWWALALWPTADEPPAWLARARWVCFNAGPSGLPDASGWLVLIGEPLGLGVALFAAFGRSLRLALRAAAASRGGIAAMSACAAAILVGLSAAGVRVANAAAARDPVAITGSAPVPSTYPRLDCPAPALGLIDQVGARIDLDALRGRPALVTFAFAHCETVCPALVSQTLAAQRRARAGGDPSRVPRIAIVTLDPWRDTPARLPALADAWRLGRDASVLSGPPAEVNAALDAWNVPRTRNPSTGQLDHPALVYVLDPSGRIAYAANGDEHTLSALLERL